jgi:hypothetical protein
MKTLITLFVLLFLLATPLLSRGSTGAATSWTTYEAEAMSGSRYPSDREYYPGSFGVEASGRQYLQLFETNDWVQFTALQAANRMLVRYAVPDTADGAGADYTLSLYTNGVFAQKLSLTSKYSWLYGGYPFSNHPADGSARNLYDEVRFAISVAPGDVVRLQKDPSDLADYYSIDLVDLENVAAPLTQPGNSLSILTFGADATGVANSTSALRNCISSALSQGKSVWAPAGTYKITGSISLPSNLTVQGAGMWHTTFTGDAGAYATASSRVTFNGNGNNIHLSDFAIVGKLNYRNDSEPNDGLGGSYGTGSSISRIWVEHTKTGAWVVNSFGLVVDGCRFRDTIADGINLAVGMRSTMVTNCTARGTGDDCFAMWPATYISQSYTPGFNTFTHCTGQLPFLANCGAIYGAVSNTIQDCFFQDSCYGCGVLISTTFPVGGNVFNGVTTVRRCDLNRCGGMDHGGNLSSAVLFYLNNARISGIDINNVNISNSLCDGLDIIAPGSNPSTGVGTLSNAIISNVTIPDYGVAFFGSDALWADSSALGSLTVSNCTIVDYRNFSPNFTFNFTNTISRITSMFVGPDGPVTLSFTATPGYPCRLEYTTNLTTGSWETVNGSAIIAPQPIVTCTDQNEEQSVQRFYRSVLP